MTSTTATWTTLLDVLFDDAQVGRCLVAPDGTILRANREWLRSTGFTEDVLGEDVIALFPGTRDMALALHARARAGHRVAVPRHAQLVNGRESWWEGRIDPIPMEGGTGLLITSREVAASAERPAPADLVTELRASAEILELGDAFCELDAEFRIVRVNARQEQLTGIPRGESVGRTHWELWPESARPDSPWWREYHRCMSERVPVAFENYYAPLDLWSSVTAYPTRSGGIAIFFRDVSAKKRAEQELRAAAARQQRMIESITDGLLVLDREWRCTYVSGRAGEILGMPPHRLVGGCLWDLFPHARGTKFYTEYHRALETGRPVVFEEYYPEPLNQWFECRSYPSDEGLTVYFHDVTARKQAEDALRESAGAARRHSAELEALLDAVPAAVFIARDPRAARIDGNRRAFDALRLPRGANLSKTAPVGETPASFRALRRGVEIPVHELPMQRAARGEEVRGAEFDLHFDDGEVRCFLGNATTLRDPEGRPAGAVGAFVDVTSARQAEEALRDANARLREADRRKDEFLGMLSHELRNPLAPIRNSSYILREAPPGSDPARRAQAVIERQAEHLTRIVDDLLDVTRVARGKIELRRARTDLREVILRSAEDFRGPLDGRGVSFHARVPDGPVWAFVDVTRVTQVVGNLLSNAVKFTRRGDQVALTLDVDADAAVVTVRDTGAGIDPALLPSVFDPFVQGERTLARSEGGLGLGLALVKGVTELHGGTVAVSSAGRGTGAEFVVRLPLEREARGAAPGSGGTERREAPRRVLVVDDNRDAADTLADLVRMLGHDVDVAYDGPGALETVRARRPDVVLCDVGLPGMSGYDVARAVRAAGDRAVRLVAVTGYAQAEDVARALEAGFDAHVPKPPDPERLVELLSATPASP